MPSKTYFNEGLLKRVAHLDPDKPDKVVIQTIQRIDTIIDTNLALAETHPEQSVNKLLARVPVEIYEKSLREDWDENDWKKFLNDPNNKYLRVWPGKV